MAPISMPNGDESLRLFCCLFSTYSFPGLAKWIKTNTLLELVKYVIAAPAGPGKTGAMGCEIESRQGIGW
jgi:hypothetical protein